VVLAVHHVDEIIVGHQQLVWHVKLARVGAGSVPVTDPRLNRCGMKTESPPPKVRRCAPLAKKQWSRFWPYASETKMSPLGASTAWVGMLNG
jgi:hypothetical protein